MWQCIEHVVWVHRAIERQLVTSWTRHYHILHSICEHDACWCSRRTANKKRKQPGQKTLAMQRTSSPRTRLHRIARADTHKHTQTHAHWPWMGFIEAGIESESIIAYPEPACGRPNFSGVYAIALSMYVRCNHYNHHCWLLGAVHRWARWRGIIRRGARVCIHVWNKKKNDG